MNLITSTLQFTKFQFGNFSVASAIGYRGTGQTGFEILTAGDLNNDRYDDLVISCRLESNPSIDGEMKILILYFNSTINQYEFNLTIQSNLSLSLYPRRASVLDFNNDGLNDLFIADHGIDGSRIGYPNSLYLNADNSLKAWSPFAIAPVDYSHGVIIADFNKDGRNDVLVLNSFLNQKIPNGISSSYVIGSIDKNESSIQILKLENPSDINFDNSYSYLLDMNNSQKNTLKEYLSGFADDLNGDQIPDLILAGSTNGSINGYISILKSSGIGDYRKSFDISLNADFSKIQNSKGLAVGVSEITTYDIDSDGKPEIIAALFSQAYDGGGWSGLFFQVLKESLNGSWQDISSSVFPQQFSDQTSNDKWANQAISKVDLDGDGDLDLVISSGGGTSEAKSPSSAFWIFEKGQFLPWKPAGVPSINDGGFYPTVVDLNGDKYVVWLDNQWDSVTHSAVNNFFKVSGIKLPSSVANQGTFKLTNIGTPKNDFFESMAGDTNYFGSSGIDSVLYFGKSQQYELRFINEHWLVSNKEQQILTNIVSLNDGSDILDNVERLFFTDKSIAIDTNGNAGTTAKILGAVFGKDSISNKNYVGIGLHFLDAGWTYDNLAGLALDAAGAKTNEQVVSLLWNNVIGTKPTAADKQPFIALLENGMTAGALAHLAADSSFNTTNINLVGLAQTGIEYIPVS